MPRRASQKAFRIVFEFLETANTAEIVSSALVFKRSGTPRRIDLHPAHWIDNLTAHGGPILSAKESPCIGQSSNLSETNDNLFLKVRSSIAW
jgi:hypothetical protein